MSRYVCMDGGPIDPPDYPEPRPCAKCNASGSLCDWCGLPAKDGAAACDLAVTHDLCSCEVRAKDVLVTQLELLGYIRDYDSRLSECETCHGGGLA